MRKVSLAIIEKNGKYLVEKFYDKVANCYFYKLIGGGIEQGETPAAALMREFKEELSCEIDLIEELNTITDSFEYLGIHREVEATIIRARFKKEEDSNFRQKFIYSPQGTFLSIAMWKSPQEIQEEKLELYPRPIIEKLLKERQE